MKSVLLVYENAADVPRPELDGRTPLQVARCAAATRLASEGRCGVLGKVPSGETARAEAMLAALCGVPREDAWRLARGPLEAESAGVDWSAFNYAYRGDFVTLDEGVMRDSWLSKLSLQETERLVQAVQAEFDPERVRLLTLGPAHVVVLVSVDDVRLEPGHAPWAVEGEVALALPAGKRGRLARDIMDKAAAVLTRQTINDVRVDLGENPASALWLWGGGPRVDLPHRFGGRPLQAAMLTQSAMAAGLGRRLGMKVEPLLDPWAGHGPADVVEPGRLAGLLKDSDLLVVYVEAPAELVRGAAADKVRLLERMDVLLTQPLLDGVRKIKLRRMALATLDATVGEAERERAVAQPVAVWGAHVEPDGVPRWEEAACARGELGTVDPAAVLGLLSGE
jgi:2,3-bisphosphoglycerate-independent phosphoglycerate mutase